MSFFADFVRPQDKVALLPIFCAIQVHILIWEFVAVNGLQFAPYLDVWMTIWDLCY